MAELLDRKLFIGPRLKRIRRELGLTQTRMAEELEISASYLNLIEHGQRPATAQFLIKLAAVYDVDIRALDTNSEHQTLAEIKEVFSDPLFARSTIPQQELREFAEQCPSLSEQILRLYRAFAGSKLRDDQQSIQTSGEDADNFDHDNPLGKIREIIRDANNHFSDLDKAAEDLSSTLQLNDDELYIAIKTRLHQRHAIDVRIMPVDVMLGELKRFDRHRKRLMISELMEPPARTFQAAYQLALVEQANLIDTMIKRYEVTEPVTKRLARVALANYFAGAVVMPYGKFLDAAESLGYDIEVLAQRFGASYEQVCHRLTTLQKPTARGIPFFFIRIDNAGNISKRFSAGKFHFSEFGGTCPLWNVHSTFRIPGNIFTQIVEMPDGTKYFSVSRTVKRAVIPFAESEQQLAIGLGCDLKYANRLVYSKGFNLDAPNPTLIGINCQLCDRPDCQQRAHPPRSRNLVVDEFRRSVSPFRFEVE